MKEILKLKYLSLFKKIVLFLFIFYLFNIVLNITHDSYTIKFIHNAYALDIGVDNNGKIYHPNGLDPDLPSISTVLEDAVKYLVHLFFVIPFSWLATFGADMSGKLIDPAILNAIFLENSSSTALYNIWTFIRDIFNVFFIFILLFSAFATVFQVQKYHLLKSNVLVMIIIMTLLVNFSWPITRTIMDAGNITMFYLIDTLLEAPENAPKGEHLFGSLIEDTRLIEMLTLSGPKNQEAYDNTDISDQIVSAVFLLFFAITFLTIAVIFLIRTALFVILLIFSPIGFAAAVFPGTKKFATMWWSNMIKWTFIGPVMIFIVFISTVYILRMRTLSTEINTHGFSDSTLVTNGIIYLSGLVMLWSGMLVANKMGGDAAKFVTSRATKTRNFAMRNYHRVPQKILKLGSFATLRTANYATKGELSEAVSTMSGTVSSKLKSVKKRLYSDPKGIYQEKRNLAEKKSQEGHHKSSVERERQAEYEKELKNSHVNILIDKADIKNKNAVERNAARKLLKSKIDKNTNEYRIKTEKELIQAISAVGDDTETVKALLNIAPKDMFKGPTSTDLYGDIRGAIYSNVSPGNIAEQTRAAKQTKELRKKFSNVGRADIIYDHYKSTGDPNAAKNALGNLNVVKDIAKQENLLKKLATHTARHRDIKVYIDPIIDSPSLRSEFIKNASKQTRHVLERDILDADKADKQSDELRSELIMIENELRTLGYASTLSSSDIAKKTALEARKRHLNSIIVPKKT